MEYESYTDELRGRPWIRVELSSTLIRSAPSAGCQGSWRHSSHVPWGFGDGGCSFFPPDPKKRVVEPPLSQRVEQNSVSLVGDGLFHESGPHGITFASITHDQSLNPHWLLSIALNPLPNHVLEKCKLIFLLTKEVYL